jgi:hypothetical protein
VILEGEDYGLKVSISGTVHGLLESVLCNASLDDKFKNTVLFSDTTCRELLRYPRLLNSFSPASFPMFRRDSERITGGR